MSLDSVELLMRFEKEFKKDVPYLAAEKIGTVGEMSNWFYQNLTIHQPDRQLENEIYTLIKKALKDSGLSDKVSFEQKVKEIIPKENLEQTWEQIATKLKLKMPRLNKQDLSDSEIRDVKILGIRLYKPKPAFLESDFKRLVECVGALNYDKFVDFDKITSKFEIDIAVIGLTYDQCGVDVDEVFLNSSFTNDLGID